MAYSDQIKKYLLHAHAHFILLLFFFSLNGYRNFRALVNPISFLFFFGVVLAVSVLLFLGLSSWLQHRQKAGLLVFYGLFIFLFFGNLEDAFARVSWLVFLSEPIWFIPFMILISVMMGFVLLRSKRLRRFHVFLNLLFGVLTAYEVLMIVFGSKSDSVSPHHAWAIKPIAVDQKIPVYLVVLDEYAGDSVLWADFKYDNRSFKAQMKHTGFADVQRTRSNYPLTVYSVASLLNMDYLSDQALKNNFAYGYKYALAEIRQNRLADIFSGWGYEIKNYSFFDFRSAPAYFSNSLWGGGIRPVTARCMHIRLLKHVVAFADKNHFGWFPDFERDHNYRHITEVLDATRKEVPDIARPSFQYLHFMTPHKPYLFDSTGEKLKMHPTVEASKDFDAKAYSWSVRKINLLIQDWSRDIIEKHMGRVVILILSDHGPVSGGRQERSPDNLLLVYTPERNDAAWYEGMTNVNAGRTVLNQVFRQQIPLLKDSFYQLNAKRYRD